MKYALLLLAGVLLAGSARADVVYDFTAMLGSSTGVVSASFTLTLPVPLAGTGATGDTPDQTFSPGANLVCNLCEYIDFYSNAVGHGFTVIPSDAFGYKFVGGQEDYIYFAPGDVTTNGVYFGIIVPGTLTVSGVASTTVPEPSSFELLALTLTGLALRSLRRRKTAALD